MSDLHPFYRDLLGILFDDDHYRIALAQLATARSLMDGFARDYSRFLTFVDSQERTKELKWAALEERGV